MCELIATHGSSQRKACRLLAFDRSVGRYKTKPEEDEDLKSKIVSIAHERKRFGYRRIHIMLKRDGLKVNHKRVYRLYKEMGLIVRRRDGRKRALGTKMIVEVLSKANQDCPWILCPMLWQMADDI